jgi:uncharacterized protein
MISEDRQSHLAHILIDGIWNDDLVEFTDEDMALRIAKKAIVQWVNEAGSIDQAVRHKIGTLKKSLTEGTPEWDIMYSKYYEEEVRKLGTR